MTRSEDDLLVQGRVTSNITSLPVRSLSKIVQFEEILINTYMIGEVMDGWWAVS